MKAEIPVISETDALADQEQVADEVTEPVLEVSSVEKIDAVTTVDSDYNEWLNGKLRSSLNWLENADRDGVSIQVMTRNKSSGPELADFLQNDWPLDVDKTYVYEVKTENRTIYRVFYNEFSSVAQGKSELEKLPQSVKVNSPYLHSVYRMQKALL